MKFIERIKSKTPINDKIDGIFCTKIGSACAGTLTYIAATGVIVPPVAIIGLVFGAILFGAKAVYHASKIER